MHDNSFFHKHLKFYKIVVYTGSNGILDTFMLNGQSI